MDNTKLIRTSYTNAQSKHNTNLESSRPSHTSILAPPSLHVPSDYQKEKPSILVFCPVCQKEYFAQQVEKHSTVHDISNEFKYMPKIEEEVREFHNPPPQTTSVSYPLVQPLEFQTRDARQVEKKDKFVYKKTKNYDSVNRQYMKQKLKQTKTVGTQTVGKPPLQYESNQSDMFSWMDHFFNGDERKLDMNEVYDNNVGMTDKRKIDEWEKLQIQRRNSKK